MQRSSPKQLKISDEFFNALKARLWPGNVRELQNVVARAAAIARGGILSADQIEVSNELKETFPGGEDLDAKIHELVCNWTSQHWNDGESSGLFARLLEVIEPAIFARAFELSDNQYSAAARRLGIHRTTLKKKLEQQ